MQYWRDYQTRTAIKDHDHQTPRKCTKCGSTLYDSIINFGESLSQQEFDASFGHAEKADVCLVLGSSLRVPPAAYVPQTVAERGGKLAIGNLQLTPMASLAQLNIHALCDDLMRGLMAKLDIPIPEWELHRRVRITIQKQKIKIMGLDVDQDIPYTLFSRVRIFVRQGTLSKYESKQLTGREFIEHKMPVNDSTGKMDVYIEMHWQGNYNEPMYTLRTQLTDSTREVHIFYNPKDRMWREQ
ncbi:unnamed protein product [Rotaria sordida]|uniref:Regulatory protein SIR2 homolog 7 n=1 Tax=Rotaria sordida TaxID=392033 RepID=A0A815C524_9BILA|nr:unnamed protein product [Rotaria sordida]CAF3879407.1 unnamed protein product [Rotaria sordida]